MSVSARALATFAVLAGVVAGSAGRATAQFPPEAGPVGPGSAYVGGQPGTMPGGQPGVMPPSEPATYEGPTLATDSLGYTGGGSHGPRAWIGAEYLLYWTKDAPIPFNVATVGLAAGTGIVGATGTRILFGNTSIDYSNFSGVRVIGGYWITSNESLGLEANLFILPKKNVGTPALTGSDILPVLARPFLNTASNVQNSRVLGKPGQFLGNVQTTSGLELWGAEIGPVWRARDTGRWTFDYLGAFKFLALNETLTVADTANTLGGGVSVLQGRAFNSPSSLSIRDEFRVQNNFYGVTLGARSNLHVEAFTWSLTGKIGLGWMESNLRTTGTSTVSGGSTAPLTSVGGLYASGPSLGDFSKNQFAAIPEFATNLNVQITSHLGLNLGYNYLYISKVLRPGEQISGQVNPSFVPTSPNFGALSGPANSTIPLSSSSFWAQGFNLAFVLGF